MFKQQRVPQHRVCVCVCLDGQKHEWLSRALPQSARNLRKHHQVPHAWKSLQVFTLPLCGLKFSLALPSPQNVHFNLIWYCMQGISRFAIVHVPSPLKTKKKRKQRSIFSLKRKIESLVVLVRPLYSAIFIRIWSARRVFNTRKAVI